VPGLKQVGNGIGTSRASASLLHLLHADVTDELPPITGRSGASRVFVDRTIERASWEQGLDPGIEYARPPYHSLECCNCLQFLA
jgi:hypothetical protein